MMKTRFVGFGKRLLAMLLALVMLVSVLPVGVFATEERTIEVYNYYLDVAQPLFARGQEIKLDIQTNLYEVDINKASIKLKTMHNGEVFMEETAFEAKSIVEESENSGYYELVFDLPEEGAIAYGELWVTQLDLEDAEGKTCTFVAEEDSYLTACYFGEGYLDWIQITDLAFSPATQSLTDTVGELNYGVTGKISVSENAVFDGSESFSVYLVTTPDESGNTIGRYVDLSAVQDEETGEWGFDQNLLADYSWEAGTYCVESISLSSGVVKSNAASFEVKKELSDNEAPVLTGVYFTVNGQVVDAGFTTVEGDGDQIEIHIQVEDDSDLKDINGTLGLEEAGTGNYHFFDAKYTLNGENKELVASFNLDDSYLNGGRLYLYSMTLEDVYCNRVDYSASTSQIMKNAKFYKKDGVTDENFFYHTAGFVRTGDLYPKAQDVQFGIKLTNTRDTTVERARVFIECCDINGELQYDGWLDEVALTAKTSGEYTHVGTFRLTEDMIFPGGNVTIQHISVYDSQGNACYAKYIGSHGSINTSRSVSNPSGGITVTDGAFDKETVKLTDENAKQTVTFTATLALAEDVELTGEEQITVYIHGPSDYSHYISTNPVWNEEKEIWQISVVNEVDPGWRDGTYKLGTVSWDYETIQHQGDPSFTVEREITDTTAPQITEIYFTVNGERTEPGFTVQQGSEDVVKLHVVATDDSGIDEVAVHLTGNWDFGGELVVGETSTEAIFTLDYNGLSAQKYGISYLRVTDYYANAVELREQADTSLRQYTFNVADADGNINSENYYCRFDFNWLDQNGSVCHNSGNLHCDAYTPLADVIEQLYIDSPQVEGATLLGWYDANTGIYYSLEDGILPSSYGNFNLYPYYDKPAAYVVLRYTDESMSDPDFQGWVVLDETGSVTVKDFLDSAQEGLPHYPGTTVSGYFNIEYPELYKQYTPADNKIFANAKYDKMPVRANYSYYDADGNWQNESISFLVPTGATHGKAYEIFREQVADLVHHTSREFTGWEESYYSEKQDVSSWIQCEYQFSPVYKNIAVRVNYQYRESIDYDYNADGYTVEYYPVGTTVEEALAAFGEEYKDRIPHAEELGNVEWSCNETDDYVLYDNAELNVEPAYENIRIYVDYEYTKDIDQGQIECVQCWMAAPRGKTIAQLLQIFADNVNVSHDTRLGDVTWKCTNYEDLTQVVEEGWGYSLKASYENVYVRVESSYIVDADNDAWENQVSTLVVPQDTIVADLPAYYAAENPDLPHDAVLGDVTWTHPSHGEGTDQVENAATYYLNASYSNIHVFVNYSYTTDAENGAMENRSHRMYIPRGSTVAQAVELFAAEAEKLNLAHDEVLGKVTWCANENDRDTVIDDGGWTLYFWPEYSNKQLSVRLYYYDQEEANPHNYVEVQQYAAPGATVGQVLQNLQVPEYITHHDVWGFTGNWLSLLPADTVVDFEEGLYVYPEYNSYMFDYGAYSFDSDMQIGSGGFQAVLPATTTEKQLQEYFLENGTNYITHPEGLTFVGWVPAWENPDPNAIIKPYTDYYFTPVYEQNYVEVHYSYVADGTEGSVIVNDTVLLELDQGATYADAKEAFLAKAEAFTHCEGLGNYTWQWWGGNSRDSQTISGIQELNVDAKYANAYYEVHFDYVREDGERIYRTAAVPAAEGMTIGEVLEFFKENHQGLKHNESAAFSYWEFDEGGNLDDLAYNGYNTSAHAVYGNQLYMVYAQYTVIEDNAIRNKYKDVFLFLPKDATFGDLKEAMDDLDLGEEELLGQRTWQWDGVYEDDDPIGDGGWFYANAQYEKVPIYFQYQYFDQAAKYHEEVTIAGVTAGTKASQLLDVFQEEIAPELTHWTERGEVTWSYDPYDPDEEISSGMYAVISPRYANGMPERTRINIWYYNDDYWNFAAYEAYTSDASLTYKQALESFFSDYEFTHQEELTFEQWKLSEGLDVTAKVEPYGQRYEIIAQYDKKPVQVSVEYQGSEGCMYENTGVILEEGDTYQKLYDALQEMLPGEEEHDSEYDYEWKWVYDGTALTDEVVFSDEDVIDPKMMAYAKYEKEEYWLDLYYLDADGNVEHFQDYKLLDGDLTIEQVLEQFELPENAYTFTNWEILTRGYVRYNLHVEAVAAYEGLIPVYCELNYLTEDMTLYDDSEMIYLTGDSGTTESQIVGMLNDMFEGTIPQIEEVTFQQLDWEVKKRTYVQVYNADGMAAYDKAVLLIGYPHNINTYQLTDVGTKITLPSTFNNVPIWWSGSVSNDQITVDKSIVSVHSGYNESVGSCGDNIWWDLDGSTKELLIYGSGAVTSRPWNTETLRPYIQKVRIDASITQVMAGAFSDCGCVEQIYFEGAAPVLGRDCFSGITADAYYPCYEKSYNEAYFANQSESITWIAQHQFEDYRCIYCGEIDPEAQQLEWTIVDGTLKITGLGAIPNYSQDNPAPWSGESFTSISIGPDFVKIGANLIAQDSDVTTVCFDGNAPDFDANTFAGATVMVSYLCNKTGWEAVTAQQYGGTVTWEESHDLITVEAKESTWSTSGWTEDSYCDRCGEVFATQTFVPAKGRTTLYTSNSPSTGKPNLSWDAVDGAVAYRIYRMADSEGYYLSLGDITATEYEDTSAQPGVSYTYFISALNEEQEEADSSFSSRLCKLARPTVTASNNAETGKIRISWAKVTGAAKYQVYVADSKTGTYAKLGSTTTGTSLNHNSAEAGKLYYYKVMAIAANTAANSELSLAASRTCDLAQPKITLSNIASTGKVKISWAKVTGAAKYQVYVADSKTGTYEKLGNATTGTSLNHNSAEAGKTYYYKVMAIAANTAANSAYSAIGSLTCDLAQPKNVTTSNIISSGKIKISWSKVEGASKYQVYVADSKAGTYKELGKPTTGTILNHNASEAGKTYYYKVMAIASNTEANSAYSAIGTGTCDLAQPVITLSNVATTGKIKISWSSVPGATSYQVHRATSSDGTYTLLKTVTTGSYTDTSAVAGKTYYYKVKGVNADVSSAFSRVKSSVCTLAQPEISLSNIASTGKIKISWEKVTGASKYQVYVATSKTGTYEKLGNTTTGTSLNHNSAVAGKLYYYKVMAIASNTAANSAYSLIGSRTCDLAQPKITLSNIAGSGKIKISWAKVTGAAKYQVYVATSKTGTYEKLGNATTGTSLNHNSSVAGKLYYYKVVAIASNTAANSAYSAIGSRTCDLARPVITLSNVASSGKIKISWSGVVGASKYQVYRATSSGGTYTLLKTVTTTSYTDTSAVAGKTYYYKVKAVHTNTNANSVFSTVKSRMCDLARPAVSVALTSAGKPKLTWKAVDGAVSYKVYRATSSGGTYSLMTTTKSLSYTNTGAASGKTYYYKVIAVASNTGANSAYSVVDSIKTK